VTRGILSWKALIVYGIGLYVYGLFAPELEARVWGVQGYLWVLWSAEGMFAVGVVAGIFLAATGRLRKASVPRRRPGDAIRSKGVASFMDDAGAGRALAAAGMAAIVAPLVNVDGTPMMEGGAVDVMGKSYGDSGSDSGIDSFSGGMDSSGIGGHDW